MGSQQAQVYLNLDTPRLQHASTTQEHPVTGVPMYYLHPCGTVEILDELRWVSPVP